MKQLRILLGDDHSLLLKGIKSLLETHYEIAGSVENGRALVESALRLRPDLVILDISMPILNGIDAAREIKKELPSVKLIFLTMHSNAIYLRKSLEAGASGYVLKSGAAEELLTAIEEARRGRIYVTPHFCEDVLETIRKWPERSARSSLELTDRQRQILQLIAEGKQSKQIAEIVHVSVKTVEFHRSRLMTKLGARSIAELTRFAIQEGLIDSLG